MAPVVLAVGVALPAAPPIHRLPPAGCHWLIGDRSGLYIFLPLLRYALENPAMFSYRTMTRLSSLSSRSRKPSKSSCTILERLTMFAWDNGEVWVISVTTARR